MVQRRLSSAEAKIALDLVILRDGYVCSNHDGHLFENTKCSKNGQAGLLLDHIDNHSDNNDQKNWQALCRSCNTKKNPRGQGKRGIRVREQLGLQRYTKTQKRENETRQAYEQQSDNDHRKSPSVKKNEYSEPLIRKYVYKEIKSKTAVQLTQSFIDGLAELGNCSQQVAKQYLAKLTSFAGDFNVIKDSEGLRWILFKDSSQSTKEKKIDA